MNDKAQAAENRCALERGLSAKELDARLVALYSIYRHH